MLFSVIVPVYNKAPYLRRCIDSVLGQTNTTFELVIVDDGSTDESLEIIRSYRDHRIKVLSQPNAGVSVARNHGIDKSYAPYIAFLDADDEWLPDHLEIIEKLIKRFPEAGIYATGFRYVYNDGSPSIEITYFGNNKEDNYLLNDVLSSWNVTDFFNTIVTVIPRSILDKVGHFKVGEWTSQDLEFWLRILIRFKMAYSSAITAVYHQTDPSHKPRMRKIPDHNPKIDTLIAIINDPPGDIVVDVDSLKMHLKNNLIKLYWNLISLGNRRAMKVFLDKSEANQWIPYHYFFFRFRIIWFVLKIINWFRRAFNSRFVLFLRGNEIKKNGVVIRMHTPKGYRWTNYFIKERKSPYAES